MYSLIGEKLSHSYSKEIHTRCGLNYSLCEVEKGKLKDFLDNNSYLGFNVTIPYKKDIIPLLDYVDEHAKKIGAVNTVKKVNGKFYGYNTDYYGLKAMIDRAGITIKNQTVAILGTGGLSNTANTLCQDLGAKRIYLVSRTGQVNYQNIYEFQDVQVVLNATPVGMYPKNYEKLLDLSRLNRLHSIIECIYNPLSTDLTMQAKALGLKYTDGLYMLVAQAIKSQEIWLDKKIDDSVIESVYLWLKKSKQNVVLIGMPSSGKTTIGKTLSTLLDKEFVDTDEVIRERTSLSPSEIISSQGEEEFRKIESQIILDVLKNCNQVVATGGGAILLDQNRFAIKHNGTTIYVKRDLDKLSLSNRPLSKSKGVEKLFNERKSIYESLADITVENNLDIDSVIKEITEKL